MVNRCWKNKRLSMIQILALLLLVYSVVATAGAEPKPAELLPLASRSLLLDITKVNERSLVAVGQHGVILLSSDARQWRQANVPVQATLTGVTFIENQGWAVGHDAVILHTVDAGEHWQIQQYLPELQKPLLDVVFKDALNGLAIGAYGQFYRTVDGGQTWLFEFHDEFLNETDAQYLDELKQQDETSYLDERASILPHFNRMIKDGRTLYLVGEIGLMAKSNDFGMSWQTFDNVYQGSFFDMARTQQGNLLVVGLRGHVFRSLRNGTPWEQVTTHSTALLNSVVLADDKVLVLGNNGTLLQSDNDGQTFKTVMQHDGKPLIAGVWFGQKLVAVSDIGIKLITVN
jgi:photosystem II stability/assembly factor-like uncharacterized protein